jgi:hypothetical protein
VHAEPHTPGFPPPPHVAGGTHGPHWSVPPHPSPAGPQERFSSGQVSGTQMSASFVPQTPG